MECIEIYTDTTTFQAYDGNSNDSTWSYLKEKRKVLSVATAQSDGSVASIELCGYMTVVMCLATGWVQWRPDSQVKFFFVFCAVFF